MDSPEPDPARLFFRHLLHERLRLLFPSGSRVLVLGDVEASRLLAGSRVEVVAVDPAEAERRGRVFDGAFCAADALDGAALAGVARGLVASLRQGAPILLCFRAPWPLPRMRVRAPRAVGERRPVRLVPREVRAAFGAGVEWRDAYALGVVVPKDGAWAARSPQAFALLAALEHLVRRWPLLRSLGDVFVLEGVRRS